MNLPLAWAAALPASLVVKQSVEQTLNSASHFFGDMLRATTTPESKSKENTGSDNGLSVPATRASNPKASEPSPDWSDRLASLKKKLGKIVEETRVRWGLPLHASSNEGVQISIDGTGKISVSGPEPIRAEVESTVLNDTSLVQGLRDVASARPDSLGLFNRQNSMPSPNPIDVDPFRIWID